MAAQNDTFYDIHMHAFNLSHPDFLVFLKRFKPKNYILLIIMFCSGFIYLLSTIPFLNKLVTKFVNNLIGEKINLLAVFQNDLSSFFLLTENCLREEREDKSRMLNGGKIMVGGTEYSSIALTPLMIDFGRQGKRRKVNIHLQRAAKSIFELVPTHYKEPAGKSIVEQVIDVFNAIKWYKNTAWKPALENIYPNLSNGTLRQLDIYPFMGINPENYDKPKDILDLLEKYFSNYKFNRVELNDQQKKFDSDINGMKSNYFAGVKLYPPMGYDAWPEDRLKNKSAKKFLQSQKDSITLAQAKVRTIYYYCSEHHIPVTVHGGGGGFNGIDDKKESEYLTAIERWESVLQAFPDLKINIAHLPADKKSTSADKRRLDKTLQLMLKYKNVYTDFACHSGDDSYFMNLSKVLSRYSDSERLTLTQKIMFGSDYAVVLGSMESYRKYIDVFSQTTYLDASQKKLMCSVNPERFLFGPKLT